MPKNELIPSFEVLGPARVIHGWQRWEVTARHHEMILGLLIVKANQIITRQEIIDEMYLPNPIPKASRSAMMVAVYYVRENLAKIGLPRETVKNGPSSGYALDLGKGTTDLGRFEMLANEARIAAYDEQWLLAKRYASEALGLWRGSLLGGRYGGPTLSAIAHYATAIRIEIQELRVRALLQEGGGAETITELLRLVLENPTSESLRVMLITAYWRYGSASAAMSAYQEACKTLGSSQALEDLHHKMIRGESF